LSQTEFGLAAGVGRKTQFNYETDERAPDTDYLEKVATLGVDVRYLVTGSRDYVPPEPLTAEEQTLLTYWRQASAPTRKAALGALVGAKPEAASRVVVNGKVRSQTIIDGDQTIYGSLNIDMGDKRRR
jgi:transcriptional regulator with XRE-family HTH domain